MAGPSIRGHQAQWKVFANGQDASVYNSTNVDVNQDSTFMRSYYTGTQIPEGDQAMEGWSGTVDFEVKDASLDLFIDALVQNNLNGIGVSDYSFVTTELYADGTTQSYVYFDIQWKMGRKAGGLQEKVTKRLEFQASGRKPL